MRLQKPLIEKMGKHEAAYVIFDLGYKSALERACVRLCEDFIEVALRVPIGRTS